MTAAAAPQREMLTLVRQCSQSSSIGKRFVAFAIRKVFPHSGQVPSPPRTRLS